MAGVRKRTRGGKKNSEKKRSFLLNFDKKRERKKAEMEPLVGAIDQGTSSTRFLVSDVYLAANDQGAK